MLIFIATTCTAVATAPPHKSLAEVDAEFAAAVESIGRRAETAGVFELAAMVRGWSPPEPGDRQLVFAIPPRIETPKVVTGAVAESLWKEFLDARRVRAAGTFSHAVATAEPGAPEAWCAALALLHRALRDDPDLAEARAAAGYVRRGDRWVVPEAARRLDRGEEWDPACGWRPRGRRRHSAEDDAPRENIAAGRRFSSDHWDILSAAPLADTAALAAGLEETASIWRQAFGAVAGGAPAAAREPFAAVLCRDRGEYVAELVKVEPAIARTNAVYWRPTQTAWFCAAEGGDADAPAGVPLATVRHEAAHQLFAEAHATSPRAGETCGFWAIEAAACHLESIRRTDFGWTVGGLDAGRVPAARRLLVEEQFHVPLAELCGLGRAALQADERLPRIYDELGGLADFFMNGRRARYREAFVSYLAQVYAGTAEADTLARGCGTSYADLDAEYERHLKR